MRPLPEMLEFPVLQRLQAYLDTADGDELLLILKALRYWIEQDPVHLPHTHENYEAVEGLHERLMDQIEPTEEDKLLKQPRVPMRFVHFAEPIEGTAGFLVTLVCGHNVATLQKMVRYACHECAARDRKRKDEDL